MNIPVSVLARRRQLARIAASSAEYIAKVQAQQVCTQDG